MNRRDLLSLIGAAAMLPVAARAQQQAVPVIGLVSSGASAPRSSAAFRAGLGESGYVDGQNVSVETHWLEGQFDRLPALMSELVRRRVAVIATPASVAAALAAKAATATIPIVFGVNDNPVKLGLVSNLARPGSNLTGMNFFSQEAAPKRLGLLHELVPKVNRVALLINPSNSAAASETTLRGADEAARVMGLQIDILNASTSREIEAAFATMVREQIEALFISGDAFLSSRNVQLVTLATRHGIATSSAARDFVEAGGLMSYGTDTSEMWHQVGAYSGQILKGAKPADLPVVQSTKFEFIINIQTARALGIEVPPGVLVRADEVIE
jgi:putative ABC transport system substrate-binding protein